MRNEKVAFMFYFGLENSRSLYSEVSLASKFYLHPQTTQIGHLSSNFIDPSYLHPQ